MGYWLAASVSAWAASPIPTVTAVNITGLARIATSSIGFPDTFAVRAGQSFSTADAEKDVEMLYLSGGFQSVSYRTLTAGGGIQVAYDVTENPVINTIIVTGNQVFLSESIVKRLGVPTGQPLNLAHIRTGIAAVNDYYSSQGYSLFQVRSVTITSGDILEVAVFEGRISSVIFSGVTQIPTFVLTREGMQPGTPFNAEKSRFDRLRLLQTGYFSDISAAAFEPGPNDTVQIIYDVRERKVNLLDIGLEQEDDIVAGFGKVVFNHALIPSDVLTLKSQVGFQPVSVRGYSARYYQPWLLNQMRVSWALDAWTETLRYMPDFSRVDNRREGWDTAFGFPFFSETLLLLFKYKSEIVSPITVGAFTPYNINSLTAGLQNRPNLDWNNPRNGMYWNVSFEQGGNVAGINLGGISFQEFNANWAGFMGLTADTVLAAHTFFGYQSIPAFVTGTRQFYVGGSTSLRGYNEAFFRGTKEVLLNLEYRWMMLNGIQAVLFQDYGNAFSASESIDFSRLRPGTGIGVRFFTPVGALRFDLAWGQQFMFLHFNIGQLF
jgi:outer membrane protein assembly factor BamA